MNLMHLITSPKHSYTVIIYRLRNFYRTLFYRGDNVQCDICNWNGTQFFNGKCPKCNSLPRTRLVPFTFRYFDLLKDNLKILHIAPNKTEYDYIRTHIGNHAKYDRMDILPYKHVNLLKDITNSDLSSGSYDLVVAWHLFEHIPDDKKAIAEVYRILTPGGKAMVSVPIYPKGNIITYEDPKIEYKDYEKVHGHYDHCRSCGLDYYKRFEAVGFTTQTLKVKTLNPNDIARFGLQEDHVVWCFTK